MHYAFGKAHRPIMLCKVTYNYIKKHLAQVFMWGHILLLNKKQLVIASQWFSPFGNVFYFRANWLLILFFNTWQILTTNGRMHLLGKHNMKMSKQ